MRHVAELAPQAGQPRSWPTWAQPEVVRAFNDYGIGRPWSHQYRAAELAHAGRHVVLSTGTASGKSLAYQLPILNALAADPRARALYLSPTKALGHDQLRTAHALTAAIPRLADVAPTAYDGDSPPRCAASRGSALGGCFPIRTWFICRYCATMPAGRCFCADCVSW
ncbi:DEAD/DEAH box helicase family protein [Mycobacterium xenopi 4042]|uniref:DEAD/DEAH box helicase family protein n=1 Tax=Mycobacterium xenopi 4042 TaxID=1299334 RepID=X8EDQ5_MYCXE|nr:DEAD/DEAH box helicase family protein [Mycobacterium xenopi 4042]